MEKLSFGFIAAAFVIFTAVVIALVFAFPFMVLWNYAAVDVLHLPVIDFWHAVCLLALSGMLFKSTSSK